MHEAEVVFTLQNTSPNFFGLVNEVSNFALQASQVGEPLMNNNSIVPYQYDMLYLYFCGYGLTKNVHYSWVAH